jgi:hypothetical protein
VCRPIVCLKYNFFSFFFLSVFIFLFLLYLCLRSLIFSFFPSTLFLIFLSFCFICIFHVLSLSLSLFSLSFLSLLPSLFFLFVLCFFIYFFPSFFLVGVEVLSVVTGMVMITNVKIPFTCWSSTFPLLVRRPHSTRETLILCRICGRRLSFHYRNAYYNMNGLNTWVMTSGQKTLAGYIPPSEGGFIPAGIEWMMIRCLGSLSSALRTKNNEPLECCLVRTVGFFIPGRCVARKGEYCSSAGPVLLRLKKSDALQLQNITRWRSFYFFNPYSCGQLVNSTKSTAHSFDTR